MRKISLLAALASAVLAAACGGGNGQGEALAGDVKESYDIKGVTLTMTELPGGTFAMGTQQDGRMIKGVSAINQVVLDGYAIAPQPVSQALWQAVMGSNPGSASDLNAPVDRVSWKDAGKFVAKLSKMTGVPFILPTEAMWEFAVKEGTVTPVKNFREWCSDRYADVVELKEVGRNPAGPGDGPQRVVRTYLERSAVQPEVKAGGLGFRVAVRTDKTCPEAVLKAIVDETPDKEPFLASETFTVGGVRFDMVAVAGGSFRMGATEEQGEYGDDTEKPVVEVTVEPFGIGKTEVTAALWKAVMGSLPLGSSDKEPDRPVVNVSWYGAQMFILKLNELTGRKFRLPTEAEWEYAARGGNKSRHYRFAGSNTIGSVAVYNKTVSDGKPVAVGRYQANELGLYDMSGNVWEWCQDCFGPYGYAPDKSEWHVMRGGSAASPWNACRVSNRQSVPASNVKGTFGFRVAL